MAADAPPVSGDPSKQSPFPRTRWSLVVAARVSDPTGNGEQALSELCRIYWRPLYLYALRLGNDPQDAEDLTQGFLARFLENRSFGSVDQSRGKLRSFLLTSFKH